VTERFVPPEPNCRHVDGVTFTFVAISEIWMCPACVASIGGLFASCTRCSRSVASGAQLVSTKHGRLCNSCLREYRAAHRGAP